MEAPKIIFQSIADDEQFLSLLRQWLARRATKCGEIAINEAYAKLVTYIDSRASSAPVAPIAPDGWISVKDRLPAPSVPVMVWQPRTTMNHPDDILINFDCIDPEDDDANTWQGHNNWRDDVACIAKPAGSIVPPHDAPYTHWQPIPADPQQEGSEAGNGN